MVAGPDDDIPVIITMRVECARCGHAEDDAYAFEVPVANSQPREEYVPRICLDCERAGANAPQADVADLGH